VHAKNVREDNFICRADAVRSIKVEASVPRALRARRGALLNRLSPLRVIVERITKRHVGTG
jgi:hypothetical protein